MFSAYILQSLRNGRYYVGHCEHMSVRFKQHNDGKVRSTKNNRPWKLVRSEIFRTRQEAYAWERKIKSYKGGEAFRRLLTAIADGHRILWDPAKGGDGVPPTAGESLPAPRIFAHVAQR